MLLWCCLLLVLLVSPTFLCLGADPCDAKAISLAIHEGDFSKARLLALQNPHCQGLAQLYVREADNFLRHIEVNDLPLRTNQFRLKAVVDDLDCWSFDVDQDDIATDMWDECCVSETSSTTATIVNHAFSRSHRQDARCYHTDGSRMCCDLFHGSSSFLFLPLLNALIIRLRLGTDHSLDTTGTRQPLVEETIYDLEQDGFLRKHDVAGILWPTGYLLSLCLAAPRACGVPELYQAVKTATTNATLSPALAVELGAGIGAPSIALARALNVTVVATDKAPHALALTMANSRAAHATVQTARLDHFNTTEILRFKEEYAPSGFAIVLGSSLQALFDPPAEDRTYHLWNTLDMLLDKSNPDAVILLAHSTKALQPPRDGHFRVVQTISGNKFGMKTRCGGSSDFEITVFIRNSLYPTRRQNQEL